MNTKFWIPTLTAIALSISAVQAVADSGWRYDEDSDAIICSSGGTYFCANGGAYLDAN